MSDWVTSYSIWKENSVASLLYIYQNSGKTPCTTTLHVTSLRKLTNIIFHDFIQQIRKYSMHKEKQTKSFITYAYIMISLHVFIHSKDLLYFIVAHIEKSKDTLKGSSDHIIPTNGLYSMQLQNFLQISFLINQKKRKLFFFFAYMFHFRSTWICSHLNIVWNGAKMWDIWVSTL